MLQLHRIRALLIVGAVTVGACKDHVTTTAPRATTNPALAAQANNGKVKVKMFQLSTNTLRIDGPGATATVNIGNSGPAIQTGMSIVAEIVQGETTREAANLPTQCLPGDNAGFLPSGNCEMTIAVTTSNTGNGNGTLVPGAAVFQLHVMQNDGATDTELASKSINVNLVLSPSITTLTLAPTTLAIDGPSANWTATLQNPANSLQGVLLQGTIVQGLTRRAAGGVTVSCGSAIGVLPPGNCTMSFSATATNAGAGGGTLVPGAANFELVLNQNNGGTSTTFDTKIVPVTLVSSAPKITSLTLVSSEVVIGGPSVDYTVKLQNPGFPISDVILQGEITQVTGTGTVTKGAGGFSVDCGAGLGVLPTTGTGTCTLQLTVTAIASTIGGALVPGPAQFVLHLFKSPVGGPETEFDSKTIAISLVSLARITAITPTPTFVVLGAGFTSYTATVVNQGPSLSGITLQAWISQAGGATRRAAGGTQINCAGGTPNVLPTGTCNSPGDIVAANGSSSGTGTLVLGPATLEMELNQSVAPVNLDTKFVPITLVATTPSIVSVALTSVNIPIGGSQPYAATLYNPTGAAITDVSIQGWITQGSTRRAAGGTELTCVSGGVMPVGSCVVGFTALASNATSGNGTLVPGAATFELELIIGGTVVQTKNTAVNLIAP